MLFKIATGSEKIGRLFFFLVRFASLMGSSITPPSLLIFPFLNVLPFLSLCLYIYPGSYCSTYADWETFLFRAVFTDYYIANYPDSRIYGVSVYLRMKNVILYSLSILC